MKIPQCSRVRASVPHRGAWVSGEGQGPGGHLVMETCGKEAGASSATTSRRQKTPKEDMLLPSFRPTRPRQPLGLRSALPQEEISTQASIPDTSSHSPEDP